MSVFGTVGNNTVIGHYWSGIGSKKHFIMAWHSICIHVAEESL